jgi:penicillin-binding protein-related factor A (putative recombinase)
MTPEGKIKAEIKKGLGKIGAHFFQPVPSGYGKSAVDFIVCYRGWYLAIEAKRADGKGRLTALQAQFLAKVEAAGGAAVVATSWEDVEVVIHDLDFWSRRPK